MGSFLFSTKMQKSVELCRTLFLAFLRFYAHNIISSVRSMSTSFSFPNYYLSPLGVLVVERWETLVKLKAILDSIIGLFRPNNKTSTFIVVINNLEVHVSSSEK